MCHKPEIRMMSDTKKQFFVPSNWEFITRSDEMNLLTALILIIFYNLGNTEDVLDYVKVSRLKSREVLYFLIFCPPLYELTTTPYSVKFHKTA